MEWYVMYKQKYGFTVQRSKNNFSQKIQPPYEALLHNFIVCFVKLVS